MTILDEIFACKHSEVERQKQIMPVDDIRQRAEKSAPPLDFVAALKHASGRGCPALIAEVKYASPSRGVLAAQFDPLHLARLYAENGAAAISVLTDERYFKGSLSYLEQIAAGLKGGQKQGAMPPLLRKDFIYDAYQIYEARAAGADALLLIAAALEPGRLAELHALTLSLGMAALVEIHNLEELHPALKCQPALVGINNRDLHDFSVDLETTLRLRSYVPKEVCLVSESGIHTSEDVQRLAQAGVDAMLVGEALVSSPDVGAQVRRLAAI